MKDIVNSYKSAFKHGAEPTFQDSSSSRLKVIKPSQLLVAQQSQNRLRNKREILASKYKTNYRNLPKLELLQENTLDSSGCNRVRKNARCDVTCSFCYQSSHKISTCLIMNDFKEKWRLISSDIDRDDLIHRLCTNVEVENTANNKMVTKLH